jgi:hypothetical protein
MKSLFACAALSMAAFLLGCATSDIAPMGQNSYMITRHVYGFVGTAPIKAELLQDADAYCKSHGKVLLVTKTVEVGLGFGREASAEVYFKALDPNDPELKHPPAIQEIIR